MAAVVAVGIAAVVDAARDGKDASPRAELAEQLREAGVRGRLIYASARCLLRALSLPDLEHVRGPRGAPFACSFSLSPDGRRVAPGNGAWDASSFEVAQCSTDRFGVDVRAPGRSFGLTFTGCPPSFRPGGNLTVARGEALVEVRLRCPRPPCERVLLGRDEFLRAAAGHPNAPASLALMVIDIREVEWLSRSRVAVLLELRFLGRLSALGPQQLLAIYEGSRLVFAEPLLFGPKVVRLEASPTRRYLALEPGRIVRRDGSHLVLPPALDRATDVAWSPREAWTALATRASVFLVRTHELGDRSPRLIRIPLTVRDLAWRDQLSAAAPGQTTG